MILNAECPSGRRAGSPVALTAMAGRKTTIPYSDLLAVARDAHRARPSGPLLTPGEFQKLLARSDRSCAWPTADAVLTALAVELAGDAGRLPEVGQPDLRRAVEEAWASGAALQAPLPGGAPRALDENGWTPALAQAMAAAQVAMRDALDRIGVAAGAALRTGQAEADDRIKRGAEELNVQVAAVRAQLRDAEIAADVAARQTTEELRIERERAAAAERTLREEITNLERSVSSTAAELRLVAAASASARDSATDWQARHRQLEDALARSQAAVDTHRESAKAAEIEVATARAELGALREALQSVKASYEFAEAERHAVSLIVVRHEERIKQLTNELVDARREHDRLRGRRRQGPSRPDPSAA